MKLPDVERLREALSYDPETGLFVWTVKRKGTSITKCAGWIRKSGYRFIGFDGVTIGAHRIAWAMTYGEWATEIIDHKNGDTTDNRIDNLRLANKSLNAHNAGAWATNTSGFKCVFWNAQKSRWFAKTTVARKVYFLGLYDTKEAAHAAYVKFITEKIGEYARTE